MNNHLFKIILCLILLTAVPLTGQNAPTVKITAALDQTTFDAKGKNETLLHVHQPGRYSIQAKSKQGTAITIVDRMAGPYTSSGSAGNHDGRLDLLLDKGTYKIRLHSHSKGSGKAELKVFPFKYIPPVPRVEDLPFLQPLQPVHGGLEDLQQQAFWIEIKTRRVLRLEMLGRNLSDARLWRDGTWLEAAKPTVSTYEPVPGRPMTHVEFHHDINPGLYLLTCYGGPVRPWAKENNTHPFHLRMGIPRLGTNGQRLLTVSPFGRDTFQVGGKADFFQLVRREKKPTRLTVTNSSVGRGRFLSIDTGASITKESRDPWCIVKTSAQNGDRWITVAAPPGDQLELDYFMRRRRHQLKEGAHRYWISSIHSAEGRDAVDTTGILTYHYQNTPVKADVLTLTPGKPIVRRVNLLGEITVFLFVQEEDTYVIHENPKSGAKGSYQIKPFMIYPPKGYKAPHFREAGKDFDVTAGYHVLTIRPKSKGILHFALNKKANWLSRTVSSVFSKTPSALKKDPQLAGRSLLWPEVKLPSRGRNSYDYSLYLNHRHGVDTGIIVRRLPLDLRDPLPVPLNPGQSVMMKVRHPGNMKMSVTGGKYSLKVNNVPWDGKTQLSKGFHHIEIINKDSKPRLFNVATEVPEIFSPPPPVLKPIEDIFPILTAAKPLFRNFDYKERLQFLLLVETPALYRLETTGRMATSINVRSRTITSLFKVNQNGIGRNALVQQYLKAGDYLVNVQTLGQSKGRAGIFLKRTELKTVEGLTPDTVKRLSVPADAAVRFPVTIAKSGRYSLSTDSLGKPLTHRWEDADGWPLEIPGRKGSVSGSFAPGDYFYYSLPLPVHNRRVTSLRFHPPARRIAGKGPHQLYLNKPLQNIWVEDEKQLPDVYHAGLTAPIWAELSVPAEMKAIILSESGEELGATVKGKWEGRLPAGDLKIEVGSIEKNNRLSYTIGLTTSYLIPGLEQTVKRFPETLSVSLGEDALVDITSFGDRDVSAVLLPGAGEKRLASVDDIPNDWNFRVSRNLEAGGYRLKIVSEGVGSGSVVLRMNTRLEQLLPTQGVPFSVVRTLGRDVLKIPFSTGEKEILLHLKTQNAQPLKMVLMRGEKRLAEGTGQLYIPLPGGQSYTLLVWADEDAPGETRVEASVSELREVMVSGRRQSIPTRTAVRLKNEIGYSFRFNTGKGNFYYSPLLERPCLPVTGGVEGTSGGAGWLVGTGSQVRLETFAVKGNSTADVTLTDVPLVFSVTQPQAAPLLLEVKSVNTLMGAAVFPAGPVPERPYVRTGMLAAPSRTITGFPGKGDYRVMTWSTAPTPPVFSQQYRFDTAERLDLKLTGYPKQGAEDFRSVPSVGALVEPGRSVWLELADEPQLVALTLARGLTAFSWDIKNQRATGIAAALDKNGREKITVNGGILYVVNTSDRPARFRAEKQGPPPRDQAVLDPVRGFEKVMPVAGTLQFQLPDIATGRRFFVAGTVIDSRLWGKNGKLYRGDPSELSRNFHLESYPGGGGGFLEIRHGPGLVKAWIASAADDGRSFLGDTGSAQAARFEGGMGSLTGGLQAWKFTMDRAGYISFDTPVPSAMTLMDGEEVLYISTAAFRTGHRLNYYLSAGTYRLLTRPLPGGGSGGGLTLKTITPMVLEEDKEVPLQLIRPGEIQVFRFVVKFESNVGVGLRTESDSLDAQLFDEKSQLVSSGPLAIKKLPPGTYLLVVRTRDVPVQYRPVILGTLGSREGVPDDVVQKYKKEANR